MKILKRIFFVVIFLVQILIALIIYAYSAHYWSLTATIVVGLVETIVTFWAYNRLFKKKQLKKSYLTKHVGIVKKMPARKINNGSKSYYN